MKKTALTIALTFVFALPMLIVVTQAKPQGWYIVASQGGTAMKSEHGANGPRGRLKCNVPNFHLLHRDNNDTSVERQGWIYVRWKIPGAYEWEYKDTRGKWCPDWNRHGWVHTSNIRYCGPRFRSGYSAEYCAQQARMTTRSGEHRQIVFKAGGWGEDIPVFESTSAFFAGRKVMRSQGDTNNLQGVKCRIPVGSYVNAKAVKNWGVSHVTIVSRNSCPGFNGYIDRELLKYWQY